KTATVREVGRVDRLVHAREDVPEVQLLRAKHVVRRLHAHRRRDARIVGLGLEGRTREDEGGNNQGELRDTHCVTPVFGVELLVSRSAIRHLLPSEWPSRQGLCQPPDSCALSNFLTTEAGTTEAKI